MISVIIPVYNLEDYIERCINSVLIQTFKNFEIVCVDDKSQDRSVGIVERIAKTDSRVKLLRQPRNLGPAMARSYGCREAKGSYIFFLDGDDTLPSNALELLYTKIMDSKVDIVRGSVVVVGFDGGKKILKSDSLPYGSNRYGIYRALLEGKFRHTLWATLYKRELLVNYSYHEYPNMRNGEDAYLFYQLVENIKNGVVVVPDIVYMYYMNEQSSTHVKLSKKALEGIILLRKYITGIDYGDDSLTRLSYKSSTKIVKYLAFRNGFSIVQKLIDDLNAPQFLSLKFMVKYMSSLEIVEFYLRRVCFKLKKKIT